MRLYDKIYVPHPTGDYEVFEIGFENPERGRLINEENVIVLTIEELRECFNWGMSTLEDTKTPYMSFEDFLKHKGIQL